ncbi:transposase [Rhodococcus ruber BKS 20-38]|uniref:Transposase n=1 Tax=Rhodococcus ruber BKS 20-38 TaxID=1278076 RepID=M2ZIX5_9NOCA|nr:transposase [Rhodococcus ruber BKS 20-38]
MFRELGVPRSRGAAGTCADNAAAESLNATLKRETLPGREHWDSAGEARVAVVRWTTGYNTSKEAFHPRSDLSEGVRAAIGCADHRRMGLDVHIFGEPPIVWHILATGVPLPDLGTGYLDRRIDPAKETRRFLARLHALGHLVAIEPTQPEA